MIKKLMINLGVLSGLVLGYAVFGNWPAWRAHEHEVARLAEAKRVMAAFHGPEEVIARLKQHLDHTPKSAQGWFLLSRLEASQGEIKTARQHAWEAHQLAPARQDYFAQYLTYAAIHAAQHHRPQLARKYWRRLLGMLPADSEDAKAVRRLLAKDGARVES